MAISIACPNTYLDHNNKQRSCGVMEPVMDPATSKVYCSLCGEELTNINHFQKTTMKAIKQFRIKSTASFSVKCQICQEDLQPKIVQDQVVCPACLRPHQHLSEPFKIMLKAELKTANKEII